MTPLALAFLWALLGALAVMLPTWLLSLAWRDASVADVAWGPAFVASAVAVLLGAGATGPRGWLALALVAVWATRLAAHLAWRARGRGEDPRYAAMRRHHGARFPWVSLFSVFLLQAVLATVVGLPVVAAVRGVGELGWLDGAGAAVWLAGFLCEAVADAQLARFKADPANRDQVMDRGLWGRSRHPNYFGEAILWWGLGLLGLAAGAPWSLVGPAVITFLLLRVSGVTLLERTIVHRRPAYADYVRRTPAFLPLGRPPSQV